MSEIPQFFVSNDQQQKQLEDITTEGSLQEHTNSNAHEYDQRAGQVLSDLKTKLNKMLFSSNSPDGCENS